jgi:amino acid adenylation domain-containing protein
MTRPSKGPRTIVDVLRLRADRAPELDLYSFLKDGEELAASLTRGELETAARALAAELQERGLGDARVLLLFPPGLDFVVAFFGCLLAATVPVPAYPPRPGRRQPRLSAVARDAAPRLALTTAALAARRESIVSTVPELAGIDWLAIDEVDPGGADRWVDPNPGPGDLAFLQYTSGSTSAPKGVMVSHGNLLANEEMIRRAFGQTEHSVIVGWLPLYHDMGLIGNVLQPLFVGARCVLMSPLAFLQRPRRWLETITREWGTTSGGPDFAYDLCVRKVAPEDRDGLDLSSWSVAFDGSEPVRSGSLERFAEAFGPCGFRESSFVPCYGLAEATLFVSGGPAGDGVTRITADRSALERHRLSTLAPEVEGGRTLVGCGLPAPGQEVTVVDPRARVPCGAGEVGEIWVHGPNVARGYFGRPPATRETFEARLRGSDRRYLRTGDLGILHGGEVVVAGRLKDLIILRGRNIHPHDVELAAEAGHRALRPGGGAAFAVETDAGERLIVVHEVARGAEVDPEVIGAAVRRAVLESCEAEVSELVLIAPRSLPRTSSGKVRRGTCRARYLAGGLREVGRSSPPACAGRPGEDGTAARVRAAAGPERRSLLVAHLSEWLTVAAGRAAAADERLEDIVLDSLAALELRGRIAGELGVAVALADLLGGAGEASLADLVERELDGAAAEDEAAGTLVPALPAPGTPSEGQRALWLFQARHPASGAANLAVAADLVGDPPPARRVRELGRALSALVDRHPALSTTFPAGADGEPRARAGAPGRSPPLQVVDLGAAPDAALEQALRAAAERPFDLETGPPVRALLFRCRGADTLLLAAHHVVADLRSLEILVEDLRLSLAGRPVPAPTGTFESYASRQAVLLAGPRGRELRRFWHRRLADAPVLELPLDRPRPATPRFRGAQLRFRCPAASGAAMERSARDLGTTPFVVLTAAFAALLGRYSGQERFTVGSPASSRTRPEWERVAGYFVELVVLRAEPVATTPFAAFAGALHSEVVAALDHASYPFARLVAELASPRTAVPPLFQVACVLHRPRDQDDLAGLVLGSGPPVRLGGLTLVPRPVPRRSTQFDLTLTGTLGRTGLEAVIEYDRDLFDGTTIARLAGHLGRLLGAALDAPATPLGDLPLISDEERGQCLAWAGPAATAEPPVADLAAAFAERAAAAPDAVALSAPDATLSYGELAHRVRRFAGRLDRAGVVTESRVALLAPRGVGLVTALLGVLEAGAAYVPLDPEWPDERLRFCLGDAGAAVAIADPDLAERLPAGVTTVPLPSGPAPPAPARRRPPRDGRHLAYVIYTSGSTGRPKGVEIENRQVARLFRATEDRFAPRADDAWSFFHSPAFDFSVWEIWGALLYGGRLVVVPHWVARSPAELLELLDRERVTVLSQTPSAFGPLVHADAAAPASASGPAGHALRFVVFGGEALEPRRLLGWWRRHPPGRPRLVNMYGITETTVHVTHRSLGPADGAAHGSPIGVPIADLSVHLADRRGTPVPVGVPGELLVGGAGLARGYLGRPALTAECFVPDSFASRPGARLYRSGDLARRHADGEIEYLGRIDSQVKIRGFRIELGEVEAALAAHPGLASAAVRPWRDEATGPGAALAAYVVAVDPGAPPAAEELRTWMRSRLPDYMVPAAFVPLAELPLTVNGKLDAGALPVPRRGSAAADGAAGTELRTPAEELLAGIWATVLGVEHVGRDADFFALGGHSLAAARVVARVRDALGVTVPLRVLFERPRFADFTARVDQDRGVPAPAEPVTPRSRSEPAPASFAQERLWFLERLEPGSPAYSVPAALDLAGPLSVPALAAALTGVRRRHEILRTRLVERDGTPHQEVDPPGAARLPVVDLSRLPPARRSPLAARLERQEARRGFDLARGPLLRARLIRLGGERYTLVLVLHHVVFDGWSLRLFARELTALYAARVAGVPAGLPSLPVQYADFALWQRRRLDGPAFERLIGFWRDRLDGAPHAVALPADRPASAAGSSLRGVRRPLRTDRATLDRLEALGRRHGCTLFMVLLAGFATLLQRLGGQRDLPIATPVAGRPTGAVEDLIGFFVNTLVLRIGAAAGEAVADRLAKVRASCLSAFDHQEMPYARLVEELAPERETGRNPLFDVMFILQTAGAPRLEVPGLELAGREIDAGIAKFDLTVVFEATGEGLVGTLEAAGARFDPTTVTRTARQLETLLHALSHADEATEPERLPLSSAAERHQLTVEWDSLGPPAPDGLLHESFFRHAALRPDAVARVAGRSTVTYGALERAARALAGRLAHRGVGPGRMVAVAVSGEVLAACLLGTLAAGGAFVVLDPALPAERAKAMAADAAPVAVVASREALAGHPWLAGLAGPVVVAEPDGVPGETVPPAAIAPVAPADPCYRVYTSGSTGGPKGILQSHRSFHQFLAWQAERFTIGPGTRFVGWASPTYDAAYCELFGALCHGATLLAADPAERHDPERLADWLHRERAELLQVVPSFCRELLQTTAGDRASDDRRLGGLRRLLLAGEPLPVDLAADWLDRYDGELYNLYGPSETVLATCQAVRRASAGDRRVPIGRGFDGRQVLVLDAAGAPCPIGVTGELVVRSPYLTLGYPGRPGATADAFRPDPLGASAAAGGYRTGDLAVRRADGTLEFRGRRDHQVKIRGTRVEIEEVEAELRRLPEVDDCAVAAVELSPGDPRLVAWVVTPEELDPAALAGAVAHRLSATTVPSAWVRLEALPTNANGKLDRGALPRPRAEDLVRAARYQAPRTETERVLTSIFEELLGVRRIGVHDPFFALGGHSLLATRALARIRARFGVTLPLRAFFEHPTVHALAAAIAERRAAEVSPERLADVLARLEGLSVDEIRQRLDAAPATTLSSPEPGSGASKS